MKKLICVKEVEAYHKQGASVIAIDDQTIITPAARDLAEDYHLIVEQKSVTEFSLGNYENLSKDCLVAILRKILSEADAEPYEYVSHKSGVKIIRGETVIPLPVENENQNVRYQEIACSKDSTLASGILEIENQHYCEDSLSESVNYILDGNFDVKIGNDCFTVHTGDTLVVPASVKTDWLVRNKVTILSTKVKDASHK